MQRVTLFVVIFVISLSNLLSQNVKCKVFLQGAYQAGSMMSNTISDFIPTSQPYNSFPWDYKGGEQINTIPSNMVDWVLVELRDISNPSLIMGRRAALLLDNSVIADTNLTTSVSFAGLSPGQYHICIYHRHHIPVMSANPVIIPNAVSYDFSDTLNFAAYGGSSRALIELESGVYGMIAGDVNKDGVLKYSGPANDRGAVLQYLVNHSGSTSITTTLSDYAEEDIRMDKVIKYSGPGNDPSLIIQNLFSLAASTSLTSVYSSMVPVGIPPFQCGDTLLDQRDGEKYSTMQIGNQCWMAENLAYLPSVSPSGSGSEYSPYYYVYGYQGTDVSAAKATSNYQTYGVLYNWPAAMAGYTSSDSVPSGVQGVCSSGWHLPGDEEWKILEGEVDGQYGYPDPEWDGLGSRGTDAGGNLKETGTTHWYSPNSGATNASGFSALPGGYRRSNLSFDQLGDFAYFWSSYAEGDSLSIYARFRVLFNGDTTVGRNSTLKLHGYSVRCIRNCSPQPTQANAGNDTLNIPGDSVILMANIPNYGIGSWSIASGTGGYFADTANPSTLFYGLPDNTYHLLWIISNGCGSTSDTVMISFAPPGFNCGDTLLDVRDGQSYNTVQIGTQCWMAENLNIGTMISGSGNQSNDGTLEKYCYEDVAVNCVEYGGLYQWSEMMEYVSTQGTNGICPDAWHIPTDEEWKILEGTVDSQYGVGEPVWDIHGNRGSDVACELKKTGTLHWISNFCATDNSGFTALPGGCLFYSGIFYYFSVNAFFWTSSEENANNAWYRSLYNNSDQSQRIHVDKSRANSVRCLKN